MASAAPATGWLRGRVKAVTSGDCLVIMGSTKAEIPPEKTITLSSLIAPRLVSDSFKYPHQENEKKKKRIFSKRKKISVFFFFFNYDSSFFLREQLVTFNEIDDSTMTRMLKKLLVLNGLNS